MRAAARAASCAPAGAPAARWCSRARACWRGRRRAGAAAGAERGDRARSSAAARTATGRPSATASASATTRSIVLVRGDLPQLVLTDEPRPAARARGLPVGQRAGRAGRRRAARRGRAPRSRATKPVQVVYGPGTFINSAVGEIHDQLAGAAAAQGGAGRAGGARPRGGSRARRAARRPSRTRLARGGRAARLRAVRRATCSQLNLQVRARPDRRAAARRPRLRLPRSCSTRARGATTPKARFAYLFPSPESALIQVRLKPGLSDAERERGDRARARGGARCRSGGCSDGARLHGHRRAGAGRGPRRRAGRLDAAAAAGRGRA